MDSIKKYLPMIILFIVMFVFFRNKEGNGAKKSEYKPGTYYAAVQYPERTGFLKRITGIFKKEAKKEPAPLTDVLAITLGKDKIESITVAKGDFYLNNAALVDRFTSRLIAENNDKFVDLTDVKEEQQGLSLAADAIKGTLTRAMNLTREKKDKLPVGTFRSLVRMENGEFMQLEAVISSEKIDKLRVQAMGLGEKETARLAALITTYLDQRKPDVSLPTDAAYEEKALAEGVRNILDETLVRDESYGVVKRSNVVYQTIKDLIANLILGINKFVSNYVFAIILATIVIKIIMLPLTIKQDKSMKKMKKLQPELDKIKEQYKGNQQAQQQATMDLYKKHGISFMGMGGCLLLLIQMPILIALFGVLRSGIIPEFARAVAEIFSNGVGFVSGFMVGPVFLWMDLVNPDPYFILPILTGVVTWLQQKLMTGGDDNPMMKNMTVFMPILMAFIALNMPSGVQIYWFVSTVLSMVQQYWIMKKGD